MSTRRLRGLLVVALVVALALLALAACTPTHSPTYSPARTTATSTPVPTSTPALGGNGGALYTPAQFRAAYGVTTLTNQGDTGKGQTVVVIDSFGSPTLQQDLDVFDQQYGLPALTVRVLAPLGTVAFDPTNTDMAGWAGETEEDVQTIHAIAPDAQIVLLTSPVSETEGTVGLPQFLQLEQYAVSHQLGNIVSMSWDASEATLHDAAGRAQVALWDAFLHQAATQQHMTFLVGSGDNGATDYTDIAATMLAPTRTVNFPTDDPWVTSIGGTHLVISGSALRETAWSDSGGGFSTFFAMPSYQQRLPSAVMGQFQGQRGIPDVASSADPSSGLGIYIGGRWTVSNGTSAGGPMWAGLIAIANQMAGHPLGFLNPSLYAIGTSSRAAQDFRDITAGNNSVNRLGVSVPGFDAVPGWDPITGFGTPDAAHLLPDLIAMSQG